MTWRRSFTKKKKKKIQWLININSTQSQQKMSTHSIHVRVVCQSAAIEHMDFVRDSYDFLKSIPAVAWKAWRFCVQENTIRSNSRHGHYNLSSSKSLWQKWFIQSDLSETKRNMDPLMIFSGHFLDGAVRAPPIHFQICCR